jgi:Domain of unknown function (DUF6894)
MPQYSFNIESDGCEFDLKGAVFQDQKAAEQFAQRLRTFFSPKSWFPQPRMVVVRNAHGNEVFRTPVASL